MSDIKYKMASLCFIFYIYCLNYLIYNSSNAFMINKSLLSNKNIALIDLNSQEQLKSKIDSIKGYLVGLDSNKALSSMSNSDLFNIRDEMLSKINQTLYLFTLD